VGSTADISHDFRILVMSRDFTCGEKKINNMKLVFIIYIVVNSIGLIYRKKY
jgi:hypothetical protein